MRRAPAAACVAAAVLLLVGCGGVARPPADDLTQAQLQESCNFPSLDGAYGAQRVRAADIPVAHTPGCGYTTFPPPVLARCAEPLAAGVPDFRGVWRDARAADGHLERIEQCGDRLVVTAGGVVHDMRMDGGYEHGVNDVAARDCSPIRVRAAIEDGVHVLRPEGMPITVTRRLEGERLVWDHPVGHYELERVCGPAMPPRPGQVQGERQASR